MDDSNEQMMKMLLEESSNNKEGAEGVGILSEIVNPVTIAFSMITSLMI